MVAANHLTTMNPANVLPSPTTILNWADRPLTDGPKAMRLLHALCRILCITLVEFRTNDLGLRSAALTYTVLLSLVPALAMSTAVVKGLGGGDQLRQAAYSYLATLESETGQERPPELAEATPGSEAASGGMVSHLRDAIDKIFAYVDKTNFTTLGTFGVVGMVLSVVLVLGNIEVAMNAIWHVEAGRSVLRKVADYLTLMVLTPFTIIIAFAASAFLTNPTLAGHLTSLLPFAWVHTLLLRFIPIFFIAATLYVMYLFFPNTKVNTPAAALGALLAATLWFVFQNIYITLQVGVSNYNAIYGSFATLPIFLIWMYLGWLFILAGAQVAFAIQNRVSYQLVPTTAVPSLKLSCAFDLMAAVHKSFQDNSPLDPARLAETLTDYDATLVNEVQQDLQLAGLLHTSSADSVLLPNGPDTPANRERIIQVILGNQHPGTPGGAASQALLNNMVTKQDHPATICAEDNQ